MAFGGSKMKKRLSVILWVALFLISPGIAGTVFSQDSSTEFNKKVRKGPPSDYRNDGLNFLKEGKFREATEAFEKSIQEEPLSVDGYINLANAFKFLGDHDKAIETFNRGLTELSKPGRMTKEELEGDSWLIYTCMSKEYSTMGKTSQAIEVANKAIELKPDDPTSYVTLGWIYNSLGDKEKARDTFDMGLRVARRFNNKHMMTKIENFLSQVEPQ